MTDPFDIMKAERLAGALKSAITVGNIEEVKACLSYGASPNNALSRQPSLAGPLLIAIKAGHAGIAKLLIAHGANIEEKTPDGDCVLFLWLREAGRRALRSPARESGPEEIALGACLLAAGALPDFVEPQDPHATTARISSRVFAAHLGLSGVLLRAEALAASDLEHAHLATTTPEAYSRSNRPRV